MNGRQGDVDTQHKITTFPNRQTDRQQRKTSGKQGNEWHNEINPVAHLQSAAITQLFKVLPVAPYTHAGDNCRSTPSKQKVRIHSEYLRGFPS